MKKLICLFTCLMPWSLRRAILVRFFGFSLDSTARIGLSWIFPRHLTMGAGARIGHFNVAVHLEEMQMGEKSSIGRGNWITGFPTDPSQKHFSHQAGRQSALILGRHSAVTKNHHLDCTNRLKIGEFTTIAGYGSQFLTHSIDLAEGRQHSEPIEVGDYCLVGTAVVILGGSALPSHSVLGAKSLLQRRFTDEWQLYAGVPAEPRKELSREMKYFTRESGFVY